MTSAGPSSPPPQQQPPSRSRPGAFTDRTLAPQGFDPLRSQGFMTFLMSGIALVVFFSLFVLHDRFDQAPHRLFKMLAGLVVMIVFLMKPRWALAGIVLAMPYVEWLPKSGLPMLNSLNLLIGSLAFSAFVSSYTTRTSLLSKNSLRNPILLFFAWSILSWLHAWVFPLSTYPAGYFFRDMLQDYIGFYMFLFIHRLLDGMAPEDAKKWIRRTALLLLVTGALGTLGAIWQSSGLRYGERVGGGFGDINKMAAFYAMAVLWTFSVGRVLLRGAGGRLVLAGASVLSVLGLILPNSRGGFVAFLVAGIGFALSRGFKGLVFGLLFAASIPFWVPQYVEDRVMETVGVLEEEDRYGAVNETAGGRLVFWQAALGIIGDHPVFGVGWGIMPEATGIVLDTARSTHNFFLEFTGEMGIPALILLAVILGRVIARGYRLARSQAPEWVRGIGEGAVWVAVALIVANFFGSRFLGFYLSGYLFVAAALVERALSPDLWPLRREGRGSITGRERPGPLRGPRTQGKADA